MRMIKLDKVLINKKLQEQVLDMVKRGFVFIYPTDTVYGIGCDAANEKAVRRVRAAKGSKQPFSVVAPSLKWIEDNLEVGFPLHLKKLPGPYTFIMKKRKSFLKLASDSNKLGVRIPNHPLTKLIQKSGVPFVTTSANATGEEVIKDVSEIPKRFEEYVDIVVDGGRLLSRPSVILDLTGENPLIVRQ